MSETPAPAAVQIAAAALGYETHSPPGQARAVVAALARAGWLHDPTSYSEQSRAEVIALISRQAKRISELERVEHTAQTVCAALDDAGRLHATTGGPELDAVLRAGTTSEETS